MSKRLLDSWKSNRVKLKSVFKSFLSNTSKKNIDKNFAEEVHNEVFSEVNCLDCANCCTSIPPIVNKADVTRIAKYLGLKKNDFEDQYLYRDEDGDMVMKQTPCVFLEEGNACSIYDVRPKACQQYPHTGEYEFYNNLNLHVQNSQYCPAVFHILVRLQKK